MLQYCLLTLSRAHVRLARTLLKEGYDMGWDDCGPDEAQHLEHTELRKLLKALRLGDDFNPYEVIRTPSEDRGRDTHHITLRVSKHLIRAIDDLHGPGMRFRDRSEYIRHYMAVGLMAERGLNDTERISATVLDPAIALIKVLSIQERERAIDEVIDMCRARLPHAFGTFRDDYITELWKIRATCEKMDDEPRKASVDMLLNAYGRQP